MRTAKSNWRNRSRPVDPDSMCLAVDTAVSHNSRRSFAVGLGMTGTDADIHIAAGTTSLRMGRND